ncbi:MAG TPA: E3 ubiquitin ligase family protein [Spirochaetia bacterium]|nr:E3 ubiquitin ligase family protein [Spirochaetia bacterium]
MGLAIGVVLVVLGAGLWLGAGTQKKRLAQVRGTETSTAKELKSLSDAVAEDIGSGSFNRVTEVKGKVVCDNPLVSELAQAACVYYSMKVSREYEETRWETDSNGNRTSRVQRGSEAVASNARSVPFFVEDATGKVKVDPAGASFVAEKSLSRFDSGDPQGTTLRIGGFSLSLQGLSLAANRRTLGYRYEEDAVPVGREIYVLGEAIDSGGELRIVKPKEKATKFIVSLKSEEELERGAESASRGLAIGAVVSAAAGIGILVLTLAGVF